MIYSNHLLGIPNVIVNDSLVMHVLGHMHVPPRKTSPYLLTVLLSSCSSFPKTGRDHARKERSTPPPLAQSSCGAERECAPLLFKCHIRKGALLLPPLLHPCAVLKVQGRRKLGSQMVQFPLAESNQCGLHLQWDERRQWQTQSERHLQSATLPSPVLNTSRIIHLRTGPALAIMLHI